MGWRLVDELSRERVEDFARRFTKKARSVVDESLV
jgi:hypothetical protein